MTSIRIMTYHVGQGRGGDGRGDPERILEVISAAAPDIVALQGTFDEGGGIAQLGQSLGMGTYPSLGKSGTAFLSYFPLRGVVGYDLGDGGNCLGADVDVAGKRLHLFNVRLTPGWSSRRRQIAALLGPELLGQRRLVCPLLLLGDFADCVWGFGNFGLGLALRKIRGPLWSGTYPARWPVCSRDRAYLRGDLRVLAKGVVKSRLARTASSHLPLLLTVQISDTRHYLQVESPYGRSRMEIAPG